MRRLVVLAVVVVATAGAHAQPAVTATGGGAGGGMLVPNYGPYCGGEGQDGFGSATSVAGGGDGFHAYCGTAVVAFGGHGGGGSIGDSTGQNSAGAADGQCGWTNTFSDPCECTGFFSPTPSRGMVTFK